MKKGRREVLSISLMPNVVKMLDHYIRVLSVSPRALHQPLGRSTVINNILHREMKRQGLDPDKPNLIGEKKEAVR